MVYIYIGSWNMLSDPDIKVEKKKREKRKYCK